MKKKTEKSAKNQGARKVAEVERLQGLFASTDPLRQLLLPLVTGASEARRGLMEWAHQVGLEALKSLFVDDAERLAGPKGKHQASRELHHWGTTETSLEFGGRKITVERPRVRARKGGEISLPTVRHLQSCDPLAETVLNQILLGVSTRGYADSIPAAPTGTKSRGASKSAVSRQLTKRMTHGMRDALSRPLGDVQLVAMMLDGIGIGDHTVVVAIGVTLAGQKMVLGLEQGSTENAAICTEILHNLAGRGLKVDDPILCVIDGGKGIRKALRDVYGDNAIVQRCQVHKRRNIRDHLPKHRQVSVDRQLAAAYASESVKVARKRITQLVSWLERNDEDAAAASLREGLEETLTILKLDTPPALRKIFATTNAIENLMGSIRKTTRNVKRWRSAKMAKRWVSVAVNEASKSFRRIKGYKNLPILASNLKALRRSVDLQAQVS
jgi:putative transposase